MISPEIQNTVIHTADIQTKNYLHAELSSSYENMIKSKVEIIRNEIVLYPKVKAEQVYSIGLGFALTVIEQSKQ